VGVDLDGVGDFGGRELARRSSGSVRPSADRRARTVLPRSATSHGVTVDASRPACASCTDRCFDCECTYVATRARLATCASSHTPRSSFEIRPSFDTAAASVIAIPAPRVAIVPRRCRWKSVAWPLPAEYMHIGTHQIRFGNVLPRIVRGRKNAGVTSGVAREVPDGAAWCGVKEGTPGAATLIGWSIAWSDGCRGSGIVGRGRPDVISTFGNVTASGSG